MQWMAAPKARKFGRSIAETRTRHISAWDGRVQCPQSFDDFLDRLGNGRGRRRLCSGGQKEGLERLLAVEASLAAASQKLRENAQAAMLPEAKEISTPEREVAANAPTAQAEARESRSPEREVAANAPTASAEGAVASVA